MMLGLLLLSAADLETGRIYRGSLLFCVLVNMKHIFLYVAPVYFVYLLRVHCGCVLGSGRFGIELRVPELLRLGSLVIGVFAAVWAPFAYTGQLLQAAQRLFPFGRGLTHAYWAPNVWALYNTADRVLAKLGFGNSHGPSSTAGFAEVYESSVLWTVPPKATFALTFLAYIPLAVVIWRQCSPAPKMARGEFAAQPKHRGQFTLYVAVGCAIAFAFGWHVHEKAILMVTLPLLVAAAGSDSLELRRTAAFLSAVGSFSMLPLLPQTAKEVGVKWGLAIAGHVLELGFLRIGTRKGDGWVANIGAAFRAGPFPGWLVLFGMLSLGIYFDVGGHQLLFRGRLEFLPLMLISDFSAFLVLVAFLRLGRLTASSPAK